MLLLALLLVLPSLASGHVVRSFSEDDGCAQHFIPDPEKGTPIFPEFPQHVDQNRYKHICQLYENRYSFATLYDTINHIPLYSAYVVEKVEHKKVGDDWKIEPQLDKETEGKAMADEPERHYYSTRQAVTDDYVNQRYTRGHLKPRVAGADDNDKLATFTLTNIAPQSPLSNGKWAKEVEEKIFTKQGVTDCDGNKAYFVTGVVPGKNWLEREVEGKLKKRVNVPKGFWTAYCCKKDNNYVFKSYWANNDLEEWKVFETDHPKALHGWLSKVFNGENIQVFGDVDGCSIKKKKSQEAGPSIRAGDVEVCSIKMKSQEEEPSMKAEL